MKKLLILIISLIAIFLVASSVFADSATTVVGGDFQLQYASNGSKLFDTTGEPLWWEFQATSYKNFSDNTQAYLQLKATKDNKTPFMGGFGFIYKVSDQLSFTWRNDVNGEFLTDGQVIGNGCDWRQLSKNVNLFNRAFLARTEIKMDTSLIQGLNLTLAYSPEGPTRLSGFSDPLPEQFLIKGKYTNDLFNVGFGYTNTRDGYTEGGSTGYLAQNPNRPLFGLYGEVFPDANQKYYWEYIDGGAYLLKATLTFDPFTLKATYGNDLWYQKVGHPDYLPNTLDWELDYALSADKTIITGMAYYLNTDHDGFANATAGMAIGPFTALACYEFGGVIIPAMGVDGSSSTSIICKYNLDGNNTLVADFNLDKQIYTVQLYVYFW